ncbi:oxidoreductase [Rhizocola hellebori]|uniref:Oxidoreductase n=1 Tax=Rhizocola hellebori TaxID=1392758 RepID=A0A8J3Q8R3_9ACTN|nr:ferredoxin--NADP reductase [Rhizocola hellebori]GIH06243.1 oxidoreductase [Rhizocola hellebori]
MGERVRVAAVIDETAEAKSFVLDLPPHWTYQPGQFVTVRVGEVARCYSLCSSPFTGEPAKITVKRMLGGHGSNWLCDNVSPGTELELLAPGGVFTPGSLDDDLLLFAGGSGITPVMSILKSALLRGAGQVALIYANRDEPSIIFAQELADLAAAHPGRFRLIHWLDCDHGPPTVAALRQLIEPFSGYEKFVCGPDPYMAAVQEAVAGSVRIERFESLSDNPFAEQPSSERTARVRVAIDGQNYEFDWPVRTKLLDLLLSKGINAPYSCRQGTCAACACRILSGEVKLLNNEILEEEDFADNYILACQAVPLTDDVSVTYN